MTTWFISQAPTALKWMQTNNIHFDQHLSSFSSQSIAEGDTVIGALTLEQAAEVCALGASYWHLSLPQQDHEQAKLSAFNVAKNPTAPSLAQQPQASLPNTTSQPEPTAPTQQAAATEKEQTATAQPAVRMPSKGELLSWHDQLFKAYIFNSAHTDKAEQLAAHLIEDFSYRVGGDPSIMEALDKTQRQGRHACTLSNSLISKIRSGEPADALQEWVNTQAQSQSKRIATHLRITLDKQLAYRQNKQQQGKANQSFNLSLPYTKVSNGTHPQSLRGLQPAQEWDLYIDETGTNFGVDASELNESDRQLGRIIALALPAGHGLQPLDKPVHAVDLPYLELESLLKSITSSKLGVLGATLKKDLAGYNWISAVHQLMRWAMLMLPVSDRFPNTRVRIHIEGRSPYHNDQQLRALQETLENELKTLLPERFATLNLSLHIMGKEHPYNGYVDAIANCWGSTDKVKRQMLARTAWRGHCLLQTSDLARTEDIYRSISSGEQVSAFHWYELSKASLDEPQHSMLHDMLQQLGERSRTNHSYWQECLAEVHRRTQQKNYSPACLEAALTWLQHWAPEHQQLPKNLQLELLSLQLASGNHQGATHVQQVAQLLPLINALTEESPQQACQAVLRIAIRSSHLYDFNGTTPLLQQWLNYPVAVPGLLNHAKLHSSMGQLYAFQGQHQQALDSFAQALASFERLSDQQAALADLVQTRTYRAIVLIDMQHADAVSETQQLIQQATGKTGSKAIEYLSRSGSNLRFQHYLLLRLLVSRPELSDLRQNYLSTQEEWSLEDSHPWHLISAYRAWLLQDAGQLQAAAQHMQTAIDGCFANGHPMLSWMGHCLQALATSLNLKTQLEADVQPPAAQYPADLLPQLASAREHASRLLYLQQLLPFNFH